MKKAGKESSVKIWKENARKPWHKKKPNRRQEKLSEICQSGLVNL